ncbi:hypothetical protein KY290_005650 [Solanum tuberosum]|uniref:DELLA protein n=1 Tax=Solanum tuberosum TaxID=4113 RepID=A0ABQ7WEU3_SOLTU|nr:hypothetical protein KY290_005650 [Solanum tuberosum]
MRYAGCLSSSKKGKLISAYVPRCFDDLLTSAGTWSSAEYEYSSCGQSAVQLESCLRQKVGKAAEYSTNQKRRGEILSSFKTARDLIEVLRLLSISVDEHQQQQQISTAACDEDDSMHFAITLAVDLNYMAVYCQILNEETRARLVNNLMACAGPIQKNSLRALYHKIHRLIPQDIVESSYSTDQMANQSILKAFADSKGALAFCPGGLPPFQLTGIGGNSQPDDITDDLHEVTDLEAPMLNIRPSNVEAVAVNSVFELHRLFSIPGAFEETNNLDLEMAEQYLGREINNLVACEGTKRVVRHETLGQWRVRLDSAGFNLVPQGSNMFIQVVMLMAMFSNVEGYRWDVKDECLILNWHNLPLIATSAWRWENSLDKFQRKQFAFLV